MRPSDQLSKVAKVDFVMFTKMSFIKTMKHYQIPLEICFTEGKQYLGLGCQSQDFDAQIAVFMRSMQSIQLRIAIYLWYRYAFYSLER